jgi:twitching motility protein PilU
MARLVIDGLVARNEAWPRRFAQQPDVAPAERLQRLQVQPGGHAPEDDQSDQATFTEFTLDVKF